MIAIDAAMNGLDKLLLNTPALERDLDANAAVIAEGIQTILRRAGVAEPYEKLKEFTRGKDRLTLEDLHAFIDKLDVDTGLKSELRRLTPRNYTGIDLLGR